MSSTTSSIDGTVSKSKADEYMADLRASWGEGSTRRFFRSQKKLWSELIKLSSKGKAEFVLTISSKLQNASGEDRRILESVVRDFIEAQRQSSFDAELALFDLGFKVTTPVTGSKKNELIEKFPQWALVLENPDAEIPKLFEKGNWQMIGNLIDADVDAEINRLLAEQLLDGPAKGMKADFQMLLIEKSNRENLNIYIEKILRGNPRRSQMDVVVEAVCERLVVLGMPYTSTLENELYELFSIQQNQQRDPDVKPLFRVLMKLIKEKRIVLTSSSTVKKLMPVLTSWAKLTLDKPEQKLIESLFKRVIIESSVHSWNVLTLRELFRSYEGPYTSEPTYLRMAAIVDQASEIRDDNERVQVVKAAVFDLQKNQLGKVTCEGLFR